MLSYGGVMKVSLPTICKFIFHSFNQYITCISTWLQSFERLLHLLLFIIFFRDKWSPPGDFFWLYALWYNVYRWGFSKLLNILPADTRRNNNAIITSFRRNNDVAIVLFNPLCADFFLNVCTNGLRKKRHNSSVLIGNRVATFVLTHRYAFYFIPGH